MAFPSSISDITATTLQKRSKKLADNVTKNNALLTWLKKTGNIKTVSGGESIMQEFTFGENGNFAWYSGYDPLQIAAQDVISGAVYGWRQAACPVVISGLEKCQNSGEEALIDLLEGRIGSAEATMANNISAALYSDGSGAGNKQLQGLVAAIAATGTYGGIDRGTWTFWASQTQTATGASGTKMTAVATDANYILNHFNRLYSKCIRGIDRTKLILLDTELWNVYLQTLQGLVRFTSTDSADMGFPTVKYMDADVVLDGGIGGFCPAWTGFFINPRYLFYRPHKDRNMVPLNPNKRVPINQDAEVQILAFMGNMTCNGAQFQGKLNGSAP